MKIDHSVLKAALFLPSARPAPPRSSLFKYVGLEPHTKRSFVFGLRVVQERFVSSHHADRCFSGVGVVHHHGLDAFLLFWQRAGGVLHVLLGLAVLAAPVLALVQRPAVKNRNSRARGTAKPARACPMRGRSRSLPKKAATPRHRLKGRGR